MQFQISNLKFQMEREEKTRCIGDVGWVCGARRTDGRGKRRPYEEKIARRPIAIARTRQSRRMAQLRRVAQSQRMAQLRRLAQMRRVAQLRRVARSRRLAQSRRLEHLGEWEQRGCLSEKRRLAAGATRLHWPLLCGLFAPRLARF